MWIRPWLQLVPLLYTYIYIAFGAQPAGLIVQGKLQPLEKGRGMVALWATPLYTPVPTRS